MPTLTRDQSRNVAIWLQKLVASVEEAVERPMQRELSIPSLSSIKSLYDRCNELREQLEIHVRGERASSIAVDEKWSPLIKLALLSYRRVVAARLDVTRRLTSNAEVLEVLDAELLPFKVLMEQEWFHTTLAERKPQLTDFLSLGSAAMALQERLRLPMRVYDEKFQILQAPSLLLEDLGYYRENCELRGNSLAVGYLDIDDFKQKFNSKYGETAVDRTVLPRFMATLEASVFGRGHAYRYGGDEYAILLPSLNQKSAESALDDVRELLASIGYPGIEERTEVSVGLCVLAPGCFLTNREAEHRAERAKNFAKKSGKNRVATYPNDLFREKELFVCRPNA